MQAEVLLFCLFSFYPSFWVNHLELCPLYPKWKPTIQFCQLKISGWAVNFKILVWNFSHPDAWDRLEWLPFPLSSEDDHITCRLRSVSFYNSTNSWTSPLKNPLHPWTFQNWEHLWEHSSKTKTITYSFRLIHLETNLNTHCNFCSISPLFYFQKLTENFMYEALH